MYDAGWKIGCSGEKPPEASVKKKRMSTRTSWKRKKAAKRGLKPELKGGKRKRGRRRS